MYSATTGLGAALFVTDFGKDQLALFLASGAPDIPVIGGAVYWSLLLSLVLIVAPVAILVDRSLPHNRTGKIMTIDIPTWVPIAIGGAMVTFCVIKLAMAGGLTMHEVWNRSVCFPQKMERRAELIRLLGNRYYSFTYSSLPILSCFLLARAMLQKDLAAWIAFPIFSLVLIWLDAATVMKAPIIIYLGFIGLTLALCGFGLIRSFLVIIPTAIVIFYSLSFAQFCGHELAQWKPSENVATHSLTVDSKMLHFARSAFLRMSASFPYYAQTFDDPNQRCGIETPMSLVKNPCFPPTKIFNIMYPNVRYVQGFAPAPLNVSAFAELGPVYTCVSLIICGVIIGVLAFFGRRQNPLSVAISVSACAYSYYVTQSSLTGSLFDSYGLIWLVFPLALMIAASHAIGYARTRNPTGRSQSPAN